MSSVLLPWKEEPQSPLAFDEATLVDNATFYQSPFDQYDIKLDSDLSACESKAEIASHILENLENLMDLDDLIKDESFLLDEKILPTILEDVEPPRAVPVSIQNLKSEYSTTTNDVHQYYYKDFDTTLYEDVVDFGHGGIKPPQGTLTPPQSPPSQQQQQPLLTTLEPLLSYPSTLPNNDGKSVVVYAAAAEEKQFLNNYSIGNDIEELSFPAVVTPQPDDIAHELAVVEELVRSRVEKMQWSSSNNSSICSSPDSRTSSSSSNFEDGFSDDPEWIPESIHNESAAGEKKPSSRKRSHSKYSKGPPEEKKVRKKEQNKNAATRYRMKKKAQVEEILSEEKILLDHRQELDGKVVDLEREIRYLKGLMRDLFKAKGLIN